MITLDNFLNLPKPEIAKLVRESGNQVCVFPINGTRRWFALEHGHKSFDNPVEAYMDISGRAHIELYRLNAVGRADSPLQELHQPAYTVGW